MIYIAYVKASFATAARRDQAVNQITNFLSKPGISADMFVPAQVAPFDGAYKGWPNALNAETRFKTQANRDDLWTQLDAYLSQPSAKPDQSYGERWDQALDAPDPDADTTRVNWTNKTWV